MRLEMLLGWPQFQKFLDIHCLNLIVILNYGKILGLRQIIIYNIFKIYIFKSQP
jgi:hypothetical protein